MNSRSVLVGTRTLPIPIVFLTSHYHLYAMSYCTCRLTTNSPTPVCSPTVFIDLIKVYHAWERQHVDFVLNGASVRITVTTYNSQQEAETMFKCLGPLFSIDPSGYWLLCPLSNFTQ